jgi:hypothetical protein
VVHIAFLTLFLGLTTGVQPFEIAVTGQAEAVEILLDGAVAARLTDPPWTGKIDLGADLAPHELVARALDADRAELAVTRQWINLPRPSAEVEVALAEQRPGKPGHVLLTWESLTHDSPLSASLTLDGRPLEIGAGGKATLPAYNPETVHVLSAELLFPYNVEARKDLIFGGEEGETFTELTAVPVRLLKMRDLPDAAGLQGWFVDGGGNPLKVAAVENGPGELYLVRVPGTDYVKSQIGLHPPGPMRLGNEDRIRSVSPWGRPYQGVGTRSELFDLSPFFLGRDGLAILLAQGYFKLDGSERLRPADAVAVAGLQAMAGGRRRIVVLLLDAKSSDASLYDPATVRRYLSAIRVPLYVWSIDRDVGSMKAWGTVESAWDSYQLERAFRQAAVDLERQRIVLIEGRHLPQSIRLSPKAAGIEIVAGER